MVSRIGHLHRKSSRGDFTVPAVLCLTHLHVSVRPNKGNSMIHLIHHEGSFFIGRGLRTFAVLPSIGSVSSFGC